MKSSEEETLLDAVCFSVCSFIVFTGRSSSTRKRGRVHSPTNEATNVYYNQFEVGVKSLTLGILSTSNIDFSGMISRFLIGRFV